MGREFAGPRHSPDTRRGPPSASAFIPLAIRVVLHALYEEFLQLR